ncbi:MAG: CHASE2 domain-containing protein [Cyanobacteria bacterium J06623_5]
MTNFSTSTSTEKRIVIKIGAGSLASGYSAAVQIGEEGLPPYVETPAHLPPAPELLALYQQWQQSYWDLGLPYRLEARSGVTNVSDVSKIEHCRAVSRQLLNRVHHWLNSQAFQPIREKLLEQLHPLDTARIILQTEDPFLQRLPWYELQFFQRYRNTEVGICAPAYQKVHYPGTRSDTVRILAVLGDASGLDTQADCALLNSLPNADIHFLKSPSREVFNQSLWDEQGWDILFFAGHSNSWPACASPESLIQGEVQRESGGEILLNATESLTIPQLKHALSKAIDRGLNTAIFNSCDGLGLAADLADLYIPQVLVMREPVPDPVAHAFLKGFLDSFSAGSAFYGAVREAREKLQGLEAHFPCATWLPVIVQNLAETPPTWHSLQGKPQPAPHDASQAQRESSITPVLRRNRKSLLISGIAAGFMTAATLLGVRSVGWLSFFELRAYDQFLRSKPAEAVDDRLLIITNTPADIAAMPNTLGKSSLSDEALSDLLAKLTPLNPQAIGLDIYRQNPATTPTLARQLADTENLFTICKAADNTTNTEAIAPPSEIQAPARIGASDFVADRSSGDVLRRHLMALSPPANSPCQAAATFSSAIALHYLEQVHNIPRSNDDTLGQARLPVITSSTFGGYHNLDYGGYQILLNYRILNNPEQTNCGSVLETPADCMSVQEALSASPDQLRTVIEGRIVLIGTTASEYGDRWLTPYTRTPSLEGQTPGVFLQAQMISQLLSAAVEGRLLLTSWQAWQEITWIVGWALGGGLIGVGLVAWQPRSTLFLQLLVAEAGLLLICWLCFIQAGLWVPWLPPAIALPAASLAGHALAQKSRLPRSVSSG